MTELTLGRWPVAVEVEVAWGDMDSFSHVNNTVYLRWFETARIEYFERTGMLDAMRERRVGPILARATVDYRIPLEWPDRVTVRTTVTRIGRTSFVMAYEVCSRAHGGAVAAGGEGVIVMMDYDRGEKTLVDEALRQRIATLEASAF